MATLSTPWGGTDAEAISGLQIDPRVPRDGLVRRLKSHMPWNPPSERGTAEMKPRQVVQKPLEPAPWGDTDPDILKTMTIPTHVTKEFSKLRAKSQVLTAAPPTSDRGPLVPPSPTPWADTDASTSTKHMEPEQHVVKERSAMRVRSRMPWQQPSDNAIQDDILTIAPTRTNNARPQSADMSVTGTAIGSRPSSATQVIRPASASRTPWAPTDKQDTISTRAPSGAQPLSAPWANTDNVRPSTADSVRRTYTAADMAMNPDISEQLELKRRGLTEPKNHLSANLQRLRKAQIEARQKREEEEKAAQRQPVATPVKYQGVPSKVTQAMKDASNKPRTAGPYLKAHSAATPGHVRSGSVTTPISRPSTPGKPGRDHPVESEIIVHGSRPQSAGGRRSASPAPTKTELAARPHSKRGEIPGYLRERKAQWRKEEEDRQNAIPDPKCPPGHTLLPEADRLEALRILHESHASLQNEHQKISVTADTLRARTHKALLESKLAEVEENIKIFSRAKVYVKP